MINQPTCVTRKSRSLIDHLVTNFLQRVTDTGIIPSSKVSDHDSSKYACVNVQNPQFQTQYKYIRDIKYLDEEPFVEEFSSLPLSAIAYTDDPELYI